MRDISDQILRKIKDGHIEPKPRWFFLLKNLMFWAIFLISILVGGVSFSVILHFLFAHDWDVHTYLGQSLPQFIVFVLPYFWIAILFLFLAIAYCDYRHTKGAYRYRGYVVFAASVFMSLAIGLYFFYTGIASRTDKIMNKNLTFYYDANEMIEKVWYQPEQGLVIGTVMESEPVVSAVVQSALGSIDRAETQASADNNEQILVKDCQGKVWKVTKTKSDSDEGDKKGKKFEKNKKNDSNVPAVTVGQLQTVKIIGKRSDDCDNCFEAREIRYSQREDGDDDDREEEDGDDD